MWCPDTSHVISAAIGTNPWAATKEERVKKKKLRKSLQFGERPIVPRRRPFWSVEWHMCAILIAADADILFVDCQLLNSCAWSWKRFFPGQQNKDELPYVRNLKNSSANTVPLAHYLLFHDYYLLPRWKVACEALSTEKNCALSPQRHCELNSHLQFLNENCGATLASTQFHSVKPCCWGWLCSHLPSVKQMFNWLATNAWKLKLGKYLCSSWGEKILQRLFKWSEKHVWEQIDPTHANPLSEPVQDDKNL